MIPYGDLKAQYHSIKTEIDTAIAGVLESSQFALGAEVAEFEKEFAAYCSKREDVHAGNDRREFRDQRSAPGAARRGNRTG